VNLALQAAIISKVAACFIRRRKMEKGYDIQAFFIWGRQYKNTDNFST
jgi:hypothetical protein